MSGIYWGIVAELLAMVATLFLCIDIMYSTPKKSSKAPSSEVDDSKQAVGSAPTGSRQAA